MTLPDFQLLRPRTLDEALALLARHAPHVQLLAGGTDLIPSLRQGLFSPRYLLDLRALSELRGIHAQPDGSLAIGALTTLAQLEQSPLIARDYPVLHQAAAAVASPLLRNMGTLGGNLCLDTRCLWYNQSLAWRRSCGFCIKKDDVPAPAGPKTALTAGPAAAPALLCHVAPGGTRCWAAFSADTPPALLCLDAELEIAVATDSGSPASAGVTLAGVSGRRRLPLREFYTGLGEARIHLQPHELVTRVFLPASAAGWRGVYRKLRVRGSIDYPLAGVAVALKLASPPSLASPARIAAARLAITAVNPAPLLVPDADRLLAGRLLDDDLAAAVAELVARTAKPLTTSALTPEYRREMVRVFARRALLAAAA